METNLRPMSLGEILDRTAQLYRQNFLLFAGIASVYAGAVLVMGLIQTGLQEWARLSNLKGVAVWTSGGAVLVTAAVMFVLLGISGAANNCAVAWVHLGEAATIRGAYRATLPRFWRYIGLMFLKGFFAWSPVAGIYAGIFGAIAYFGVKGAAARGGAANATAAANSPAMIALGIIVIVLGLALVPAFVYGVIMSLRYSLAVPASVVENLKARASLRRSVQLSKFSRGRIFMLWLLAAVIEIGLVLVSQSFFFFLMYSHHGLLPVGWRVVQQIVSFFTTTFVSPIPAIGITLFYYDQRVRKEGYDIEWMMQTAGLTAPPPASAPDAAAESAPAHPAAVEAPPVLVEQVQAGAVADAAASMTEHELNPEAQ